MNFVGESLKYNDNDILHTGNFDPNNIEASKVKMPDGLDLNEELWFKLYYPEPDPNTDYMNNNRLFCQYGMGKEFVYDTDTSL